MIRRTLFRLPLAAVLIVIPALLTGFLLNPLWYGRLGEYVVADYLKARRGRR